MEKCQKGVRHVESEYALVSNGSMYAPLEYNLKRIAKVEPRIGELMGSLDTGVKVDGDMSRLVSLEDWCDVLKIWRISESQGLLGNGAILLSRCTLQI